MFPHKKLDWLTTRLETQLRDSPNDVEARHELARAYLSRGLYHGGGELWCNRALAEARRVLSEDAMHTAALVTAGTAMVGLGRPDGAHKYLDQAMRIDAERADLHLALGALYRSEGDRHLAVRHLETACRLAPDHWEPHLYLGRALTELSREVQDNTRLIERGQYHLVQALKIGPTQDLSAPLLRDIGLSCLATRRYREAEKFFIRLREHDRYRAIARYHLGMVAYHLGKHKNAIQHFRQYLDERPEDPRVHARMAMAYLQLGEHSRAREACNQALLIDPGNRLARYTLGCTLLEEGNPAEAVRVFKEALNEHPDHMDVYQELVRLRRTAGDVTWMGQALATEASQVDRLPPGGEGTARDLTRKRIDILLEQLRLAGPTTLPLVLDTVGLVQDEGVRFRLFESACEIAAAAQADQVSEALREPGQRYGVGLARQALGVARSVPEPILTRGLSVSEEDLKRAAVDRHGPAPDVGTHRRNVEAERAEARAWQALLLLSIATRRSRAGRKLLDRWSDTADTELGTAARVGLALYGDPGAVEQLRRIARERGASGKVERLLREVVPPPGHQPPRPASDQADVRCSCCGRTSGAAQHLMAGTQAVICDVCVLEIGHQRASFKGPDEARCDFCGKTPLESKAVYRFKGVDICADCLELSLGLMEREEVDRFLAAW